MPLEPLDIGLMNDNSSMRAPQASTWYSRTKTKREIHRIRKSRFYICGRTMSR